MRRKQTHQNETGFKHNVNSKLTKRIAQEPLNQLCQSCYSILDWKKKYRKYKLRTVPGRCNICHQKEILKGHRTICDPCGRSGYLCTKCGVPIHDLSVKEDVELVDEESKDTLV